MSQIQDTLYFAYGSNLSSTQMKMRCPVSVPVGLGHLPGWTWIINQRGYANVVQDLAATAAAEEEADPMTILDAEAHDHASVPTEPAPGVYGVLYTLPPADEVVLDVCEAVPTDEEMETPGFVPKAYEKVMLNVEVIKASEGLLPPETSEKQVPALVYVDYHRIEADRPKDEYVGRMNQGIDEARRDWGLPEWYIEKVMRPFIKPKTS